MKREVKIIALAFSGIVLLNSCGSNQSKEVAGTKDTQSLDTTNYIMMDTVPHPIDFSFSEIIKTLPVNEEELNYDESFFTNYGAIQESMKKMRKHACEEKMFPDKVTCYDTVYFAWKRSINEFTLVAFMTLDWNAKGPNIVYNLMTVETSTGEMIACMPDWAASYSFPVENPEGGTSAGEKFVPGTITNNPVVRISTIDEKEHPVTFELSPDGFFVEPYAQFEAETNLQ